MAYSLIANVAAGSTTGNTITTAGIDTTGASFLVAVISDYAGGSSTISDSKSNTWAALTAYSSNNDRVCIYYVTTPTVGSAHTFTSTGTGNYSVISAAAFSGSAASSPFDQQTGQNNYNANTPGKSIVVGSITPTEDNELVVTGLTGFAANTVSIDLSFSITNQTTFVGSQHLLGAMAYKIQTTAAAVNPTWSWPTTDMTCAAAIASFKAAAAAGSGKPWFAYAQQ